MADKPVYDWGQTAPLAPSIKRVDPVGWIVASLLVGAVAALLALVVLWRPLPGLPAPPGSLAEHLPYWLKLAARVVWKTAFARDAATYIGLFNGWAREEQLGLVWRCAVAAWAFLMPAVLLAGPALRPRDGLIYLRGSARHEGLEAPQHLAASLGARAKRRPDHEIAPGVVYPTDMWTRHVLVVGGTGSGKSTVIKPLIDKIVKAGEQMLLFDPKREFTVGFKEPALIAPWDNRSLSWDIARDMRNTLDMRRLAATMIRESHDPMWSNASRQLLVGLMIYLKATRKDDWGWRELRDFVSLPQSDLLVIMAEWHPEAVRAVEKASVTTAGILINLASFCATIFDLAEAWGDVPRERRVSFVEWSQGRSNYPQIILQGHGAYVELTRSYVESIVGIVSAMVNSVEMEDDRSRKIWFVADEFAQMGKLPVRPLFEVGRSRGVRCVVAVQDFAQLEEIYGAAMVKALIGMCGTLVVGQMMQGETAEQLCKAFGTREVERSNVSSSYGGAGSGSNRSTTLNFNRDDVPLYKPSELSSRLGLNAEDTGVVLILFTGGQAYELFWPHYEVRKERAGHEPASWTRGVTEKRGKYVPKGGAAEPAKALATDADPAMPRDADSSSSDVSREAAARTATGIVGAAKPASKIGAPEVRVDDGQAQSQGEAPGEPDASPLEHAAVDTALHKMGLDGLASASIVLAVADHMIDARPGPRQSVASGAPSPAAATAQAGAAAKPAHRQGTPSAPSRKPLPLERPARSHPRAPMD